jgi:hypothetical protein
MGACLDCGCKDGDRGLIGPVGPTGETGLTGLQGLPGIQGDTGLTGSQGFQGTQGATGPQGAIGSSITGASGATGATGIQGIQGVQGLPGANGTNGSNGDNGQGRLTYVINSEVATHVHTAVFNQGVIMKNTGGISSIEIPIGSAIGDVVRVVGTSFGTGGWKLVASGTDTIQMTSQSAIDIITSPGGEVVINSNNYRDVMTLISDGTGKWFVISSIFANGFIPLFS